MEARTTNKIVKDKSGEASHSRHLAEVSNDACLLDDVCVSMLLRV